MSKSKKPFLSEGLFFVDFCYLLHFRTEIALAEDIDPNDHLKTDGANNPMCYCL